MSKQRLLLTLLIVVIFLALILVSLFYSQGHAKKPLPERGLITSSGVCPPFNLFDEDGLLIDPVNGINQTQPYSPRQTCGKCHDYNTITQGFHFQQGKDELPDERLTSRYQWVSHPGNYGGNWCSPAPLYNFLSKKENASPTEMDMTSFSFITNGCGTCHPGGGSFEFDRMGNRYDKYMDSVGYTSGGINNYDGDYYKAHWNRSGVAEGDCNLCHQPDYDFGGRNKHLANWNFRWLATAGSKLANVTGSVKDSLDVIVQYDLSKFDKNGKVSMHLVREPRNETCLNCHAKPQWKKRGSAFSSKTDVHIAKGMKCVDCHPAGSMATDERIQGKEQHQFGKGDDPSGYVRNDLDNTMRSCTDCHITGYLNAPIAKHTWLPSLHLDKLSCQVCHIPQRTVKAAMVQVSDVYNPGTKIKPPAKQIWTFYDQNLNYWNHYGELAMFGFTDQPTDPFVPTYARYKGQIFPVNAVQSAWPAIFSEDKPGLDQPRMKDIYDMWMWHKKDPSVYPKLSVIADDNQDLIPEINREEEIDAFIHSVSEHLSSIGYDLGNRKIVWVNNDRMYLNGKTFQVLPKDYWEASPYASVYKYSHDVFPAKAALGSKSCTECHSFNSDMYYAKTVKYPFDQNGETLYEPQYVRLGISPLQAWASSAREQYIKSGQQVIWLFLILVAGISLLVCINNKQKYFVLNQYALLLLYCVILIGSVYVFLRPEIHSYIIPERLWFDKNHFLITVSVLVLAGYLYLMLKKSEQKGLLYMVHVCFLALSLMAGGIMMLKMNMIEGIVGIAYTLYDLGVLGCTMTSIIVLIINQFRHTEEIRFTD